MIKRGTTAQVIFDEMGNETKKELSLLKTTPPHLFNRFISCILLIYYG